MLEVSSFQGMGGREELFGMFLSADFGDCQVAPTCSTYQSPPLCPTQSPRLKYLSVWGVGEEAKDSDDEVCNWFCLRSYWHIVALVSIDTALSYFFFIY